MSLQDHKGAVKNAEKLKARKRVFAIAAPIAIACAAFAIVLAALIIPGLNSQELSLSEAEIGSTVFFGSYEQDNDISNGKEEIEWIVLVEGSVETDGRGVFNILGGIRPTIWIGW